MVMIKAIIIDDEPQAIISLKQEIKLYCPNIQIIGEASNVDEGVALIQNSPELELLFLDIQLTNGVGFDILEQVNHDNFKTIFTTAYSDFAMKAIKFSALDYLLKPVDGEELQQAISKIEKASMNDLKKQMMSLMDNYRRKESFNKKIALSTSEGIHIYETHEILRCTSEGNYSYIHFVNEKKLMVSKTLKDLENLLCGEDQFERIHKSHIINMDHLKSYINKTTGHVVMSDDSVIPVAQRKKPQLLSLLGSFKKL